MTQDKDSQRSAKARLLEAASILFYNDGLAASGIDHIVERAGVAKKSLYNNFSSKAELIATYIEARHAEWLELYQLRLIKADTVQDKIISVFLAYQDHAEFAYEKGFRGCGLLNAAAELPVGAPGREAVRRHKEQVEEILKSHLIVYFQGNAEQATQLATHFSFLLEGSISRAGLEGNSMRLTQAIQIAITMLKS
ncbi:TetR family transcriptional regulator [Advenella kashmirensis WT001]|uniref:TetR family transcriptional regulator n=1 Tax=Advenella kashmirensis (strain DSM 17095 / LMG 22695 / WT001) TaxID=1036672 RepID=I3U6V4_ADVKW|nr:TetR/AcrR family transcriptional regulator [Advenella kashmirensis]AFK60742.1 TetR family transcriptional regulator [Advenella kashmirensis WT001]